MNDKYARAKKQNFRKQNPLLNNINNYCSKLLEQQFFDMVIFFPITKTKKQIDNYLNNLCMYIKSHYSK